MITLPALSLSVIRIDAMLTYRHGKGPGYHKRDIRSQCV